MEYVSFGRSVMLGVSGNVLSLSGSDGQGGRAHLRLTFEGANPNATARGRVARAGQYHFFVGARERWRSGVRGFDAVMVEDLYPGIDLVVRSVRGVFEYDLLLEPGAHAEDVVVHCEGHEELTIDSNGELALRHAAGQLRQPQPMAWQLRGDALEPIAVQFVRLDHARYCFAAPSAARGLARVIDPGLLWSTFLGGNGIDEVKPMTRSANGDLILGGVVSSPDFPTTVGAFDPTHNGTSTDVTITRMSADGTTLLYSTFLGGAIAQDGPGGVAIGSDGTVTITGTTWSDDFPTTPGAFDSTYDSTHGNAYSDAFVTRLAADGASLLYSTLLGGPLSDSGRGLALDATGRALVTGYAADGFPTTLGAAQPSLSGGRDAFLLRLAGDGSVVEYGTYLGGLDTEGGVAIAVGPDGSVTVAGNTLSADFPVTIDAFDSTLGDGVTALSDGFLARFTPSGTLAYASFFGGAGSEEIESMRGLADGSVALCGSTGSTDFPVTPNAARTIIQGQDGFVASFGPSGQDLRFATLLGGSQDDLAGAIAVEATGNFLVAGNTFSTDFPVTLDGAQTAIGGISTFGGDSYLVRLSPLGSAILYGSFLGGIDGEHAFALEAGTSDIAIVAGLTLSTDFPTTPGSFDPSYNGGIADSFVTAFELPSYVPPDRLRGDANNDDQVNIADGVTILLFLFSAGFLPCLDAADINASGGLDIADAVALFAWVFGTGPAPSAPFPSCGPVVVGTGLGCEVSGC